MNANELARKALPFVVTALAAVGLSVIPGRVSLELVTATPTVRQTVSWAEWTAVPLPPVPRLEAQATASPMATARVMYVRLTPVPLPTYTPLPIPTRRESLWKEGDCWYLDLQGVREVWIDGRPVAPAYGGARACGTVLTIK